MNKWKSVILSAGFGAMLALTSAAVSFADTYSCSTELENHISTGDVSVSLAEYELDDHGREVPYQDQKVVLPGQWISKIVRITNEANDAWLRAKVVFWSEEGVCDISDDMLGEIGQEWIRCGEYFYCTEPVLSGQTVDLFQQLRLPQEWGSDTANERFSVEITAQAIQANGFFPDFSQELPWFGIPIEKCIHSEHGITSPGLQDEFVLVFENGSEGFLKSSDDFFEDFGSLLPGNTMSGVMEVGSRYHRPVNIRFRSEISEQQPEMSAKLLEALILRIQKGKEVLYEGSMADGRLGEGIVLVSSLKNGELQNVEFSVHMPDDLTNEMALQQAKVRWIFSADYTVPDSSGGGSGSSGGSDSDFGGDSGQDTGIIVVPELIADSAEWVQQVPEVLTDVLHSIPNLGDAGYGSLLFGILIISSMLFGILILSKGKKQDDRRRNRREK